MRTVAALALGVCLGAAPLTSAAAPQIVALPLDVAPLLATATAEAAPAGWAAQSMRVTVVLHRTDPAGFARYLQQVTDPSSPLYRHFLTPAQQADAYGPGAAAYDAVRSDLEGYGLTLDQGSANRLTLTVGGTRAQVEAAFHVPVGPYTLHGRQVYANTGAPAVDAAIAPYVADVTGLSDLALPKASLQKLPAATAVLTPMAIAKAYDFGALGSTGAGQTIGLMEFDGFNPQDVRTWLSLEGLNPNLYDSNVTVDLVDGPVTPSGGNSEGEVLLDIDTVLGAAPSAKVIVFEAPANAAFATVLQAMIARGVNVISNSWFDCEATYASTPSVPAAINSILASATAAGISVFSSVGDTGPVCNDGTTNGIGVSVPADSPYATAVGGTTLSVDGSGNYAGESWWGQSCSSQPSCSAGGYGTSQFFSIPSWQKAIEPSQTQRTLPDVSADADPNTGITVCQADQGPPECYPVGGTSLAAPIWAAAMAVMNQRYGTGTDLNAALYARAGTGFHTYSSMGSTFAHVGLGSPDLATLSFAKPTSVQVQVTPVNVREGRSATVSGVVYGGYPSNIPMAGETVRLTATAGTLASSSVTTASDGTFSTGFTAPSAPGVVTLTEAVAGTSVTATTPLTVTVGPPASVSVAPAASSVGAGQRVAISGTVRDSGGNPVAGVAVNVSAGAGTIAASPVTTSGDGTYTATFTAPGTEGPVTLTAKVQGGVTGTATVTVTAGPAAGMSLAASPALVGLGASATVSGSVYDAFGNPVSGATVDVVPSAGLAAASAVTTGAGGQFSDVVSALGTSGTVTVSATVAGTTVTRTAALSVAQPLVSVAVSPLPVPAGGAATVTGAVHTAQGQPVAPSTVALTASAGQLGAATLTTDGAGAFTTTLTAPGTAQAVTVTASAAGTSNSAVALVVPSGVKVAASGAATSLTAAGGAAVALAGGVARAVATGGTGTLSLAQYASGDNPGTAPGIPVSGVYFDASLSRDATFAAVTVSECSGVVSGDWLEWWNGKVWAAVSPAAAYSSGCLTFEVTTKSTPSLADLTGTLFAVAVHVATVVVSSGGGAAAPASPVPAVSQIIPATGPAGGGTRVQIVGSAFKGATKVDFGPAPAASFTVLPPNVIEAVSPPGRGTVDVTVTTPGGTSAKGASDQFTYTSSGPAPEVSGVAPSGGPAAGDTAVALSGSGFTGATGVRFGGAAATFSVVSDSVIDAVAPPGASTVDVTVTTPNGPSAVGPGDQYAYVPASAPAFSDVPSTYWAYGSIETLAARGILSGFPDGSFRPEDPVTRAEFVKMLDLALGLSAPAAGPPAFTDVRPGDWFAPYVAAAVGEKLLQGVAPGVFDPQGAVTREELAVLLARARNLSGGPPLKFSDAQRIAPWAAAGVRAAVAAGLLQGLPGGAFDPLGDTTRAQAARVLALLLQPPGAP